MELWCHSRDFSTMRPPAPPNPYRCLWVADFFLRKFHQEPLGTYPRCVPNIPFFEWRDLQTIDRWELRVWGMLQRSCWSFLEVLHHTPSRKKPILKINSSSSSSWPLFPPNFCAMNIQTTYFLSPPPFRVFSLWWQQKTTFRSEKSVGLIHLSPLDSHISGALVIVSVIFSSLGWGPATWHRKINRRSNYDPHEITCHNGNV